MREQNDGTSGRRRWVRRGIVWGLLGSGALAVLLGARPIAAAVGEAGWRHMRWRHGANPDQVREHVQVALKWALRDAGTSEEQQAKVAGIATQAMSDLHKLREQHLANRDAFHTQMAKPSIDREALEGLRKAEMELADDASKRLVQALADVADVLTPEQRQALIERHQHGH